MQGLRKGVVCLLMAAGLATSASILAQEADPLKIFRIDSLLEGCKAGEGSWETVIKVRTCISYVTGYKNGRTTAAYRARQIFDLFAEGGDLPPYADDLEGLFNLVQGYCTAPNQVTTGQLIKVFVKWANDHPERHHERWHVGLLAAWSEAFSCPEWE